MHRIEWRLLEVGHCVHAECGALRGGRWQLCEFPALVALLKHPTRGWILFDTGYSLRFFEATAAFPAALYRWVAPVRFDPRKALLVQLRQLGVDVDDIGAIILSHFHGDHAAGILDFSGVPVFCSREGWQALRTSRYLSALRIGVLADLAPPSLSERVRFFEEGSRQRWRAAMAGFPAYDLFGDGSILAVELPGHAPGHFGIRFTAADDREVMLIGDAAWSTRAVRENRPPPRWVTSWLGNTPTYRDTLSRLNGLWRAEPELLIVPSHCTEWRP